MDPSLCSHLPLDKCLLVNLPEEIIIWICQYLDIDDLTSLASMSAEMKSIIQSGWYSNLTIKDFCFEPFKNDLRHVTSALSNFEKLKFNNLKLVRINTSLSNYYLVRMVQRIEIKRMSIFKSLCKSCYAQFYQNISHIIKNILGAETLSMIIESQPKLEVLKISSCPYLALEDFFVKYAPKNNIQKLVIISQSITIECLKWINIKFSCIQHFTVSTDCCDCEYKTWKSTVVCVAKTTDIIEG